MRRSQESNTRKNTRESLDLRMSLLPRVVIATLPPSNKLVMRLMDAPGADLLLSNPAARPLMRPNLSHQPSSLVISSMTMKMRNMTKKNQ